MMELPLSPSDAHVCFVQQSPELIDANLYDQVALSRDWIAQTSTLLMESNRQHFKFFLVSITSELPLWIKRWEGVNGLKAALKNHK